MKVKVGHLIEYGGDSAINKMLCLGQCGFGSIMPGHGSDTHRHKLIVARTNPVVYRWANMLGESLHVCADNDGLYVVRYQARYLISGFSESREVQE